MRQESQIWLMVCTPLKHDKVFWDLEKCTGGVRLWCEPLTSIILVTTKKLHKLAGGRGVSWPLGSRKQNLRVEVLKKKKKKKWKKWCICLSVHFEWLPEGNLERTDEKINIKDELMTPWGREGLGTNEAQTTVRAVSSKRYHRFACFPRNARYFNFHMSLLQFNCIRCYTVCKWHHAGSS